MMNVLQCRPHEAEPAQDSEIVQNGDFEKVDHGAMQKEHKKRLELHQPEVFWVESLLKRSGWPVQFRRFREPFGVNDCNEIADDNHQPEKARENSIKLNPFPNGILILKIQIKSLVVGAIA